jgi:TetR/AcrR family transcriptional regulator
MAESKIVKEGRISAQNKTRILQAAEFEFALKGYQGTRLQEVADRAGLPKTNVLYYFKSKERLYLAVLEQILSMWNSVFDMATSEDDPAAVLAGYITEKMEFSRTKPEASKIFALEIINGAPNLNKFYRDQHVGWMDSRVAVLESWMEKGKILKQNPYYFLFHIWACSQHYADFGAQITALKGSQLSKNEFAEATLSLIQLILTGCGLTVPTEYQKFKE